MADPRVEKLAHVLTHYSLELKPGDKFRLASSVAGLPLLREVYREATRAGAFVLTQIVDDELNEILLKEGTQDQIEYLPDVRLQEIEYVDATLVIIADNNTKRLSNIDPARLALSRKPRGRVSRRINERYAEGALRWSLTLFPTQAHAQDSGMSLSEYEDFVYAAGMLNEPDPVTSWKQQAEMQQRIIEYLNPRKHIRIVTADTEIEYRCADRLWINCFGKENFPDGEVFTCPIEDSVNGHVRFTYPSVYSGREAEDVRLTFKDGKVVDATAVHGQDFLDAMLNMDEGARYLGEAAFGLNYSITRFTRNILFDEKIGGTMHMALGESYPEAGGKNNSGLHWDMVCDLHDGEVYADGELCYQNGKFLIA